MATQFFIDKNIITVTMLSWAKTMNALNIFFGFILIMYLFSDYLSIYSCDTVCYIIGFKNFYHVFSQGIG